MPVFFYVCSEAGLRPLCLHFINRAPLLHSLYISTEVKLGLSLRLLSQPILKRGFLPGYNPTFLPNASLAISWDAAVQSPGVSWPPPPHLKLPQNLGSANGGLFLSSNEYLRWNLSPLLILHQGRAKGRWGWPPSTCLFFEVEGPTFLISPACRCPVAQWASDPEPLFLILFELDHKVPSATCDSPHLALTLWIKHLILGTWIPLAGKRWWRVSHWKGRLQKPIPWEYEGALILWLWRGSVKFLSTAPSGSEGDCCMDITTSAPWANTSVVQKKLMGRDLPRPCPLCANGKTSLSLWSCWSTSSTTSPGSRGNILP